jgi:LacI family transcriptional regulator
MVHNEMTMPTQRTYPVQVSLAHIARRTRLSAQTVCHVLNPQRRARYAPATVERVLRAADALGYRPNRAAQALVTGRTHLIGLWSWNLGSAYYAWMLSELTLQIQASNYEPVIGRAASSDLDTLISSVTGAGWQSDGMIAIDIATSMASASAIAALAQAAPRKPFVSIGNFWLDSSDFVGFDLAPVVVEAIEHLRAGAGCRSIAYVCHQGSALPSEARFRAYHVAMRAAGMPPLVLKLPHQPRTVLRDVLREQLRDHPDIDGILMHDDGLAMAAARALADLGLRMPDDVAMVSCGGIDDLELLATPITSIVQPVGEMCRLAWEFLKRRIEQPSLPQQTSLLRPRLVVRESSDRKGGTEAKSPRSSRPLLQ